jgi:hypothetical protein
MKIDQRLERSAALQGREPRPRSANAFGIILKIVELNSFNGPSKATPTPRRCCSDGQSVLPQDVATDEVGEASQSHASDSPVSGEHMDV